MSRVAVLNAFQILHFRDRVSGFFRDIVRSSEFIALFENMIAPDDICFLLDEHSDDGGHLASDRHYLIALCIRDEIGRYKHRRATKAYDNYMSYPTRPEQSARSEVILPMARALRTNILAGSEIQETFEMDAERCL